MNTRVAWILVFAASIIAACGYSIPKANDANMCGNDALDGDEQCDDGNDVDGDDCDTNCTIPTCGNGIKTGTEECDDSNTKDGDDCNATCQITICGDGNKQPGEECDDNNRDNGDTCESNCTLPRCGNAITGLNEVCDDGNVDNGDACNSSCTLTNKTSVFIGTPNVPGVADDVDGIAQLSGRPFMTIHEGTMFITGPSTVRSVDIATQKVTTIAGMGNTADYVDDPIGSAARFDSLEGLATDGTTLWVSDGGNHVLRAVSLTPPYAVTTVAGSYAPPGTVLTSTEGTGLAAQFDILRGLVYYDKLVYILDSEAAILQTFEPSTGIVKTVAGLAYDHNLVDGIGAAGRFVSPRLMTSNGNGTLYITDADGRSIRAFDVKSGALTTLAGSGQCNYIDGIGAAAGVYRPRGVATDGQNVYFTEPHALTIRQIVIETKQVTTLSGMPNVCVNDCSCPFDTMGSYLEGIGKTAQWNGPWDIVFHRASRSLFVSDSDNFVIRRIQ